MDTEEVPREQDRTGLLPTGVWLMLGGGDETHKLALSAGQGHRKALRTPKG